MQKHIQHNKDERRHFFRKIYLSLYWKGCEWEGVGDRTELQHTDPHSYGHNSVSFPFSWAARPWAWGLSLSGTWSSFQRLLSNWSEALNSNSSIGGLRAPSTRCWFSLQHPLQFTWTSCRRGYIIIWRPLFFLQRINFALNSTPRQLRLYPDIPWPLCTCYLHRFISYFDSMAGSEVNIQHYNEKGSSDNTKPHPCTVTIVHFVFKKFDYSIRIDFGFFGFYGISTFVGYLTPNQFLWK